MLLCTSSFAAEQAITPKTFGQPVTLAQPIPLAEAMKNDASGKTQEVRVDGKVLKVCKKKGCWLVLSEGEKQVRVTFKDYAFFVPKDSADRRARVQGTLKEEVLSVKDARHYLKDEGASKEEIAKVKAPVKSWSFVASGVEFLD